MKIMIKEKAMQDVDLPPEVRVKNPEQDKESIIRIRQVLKANLLSQVNGRDIIEAASFAQKYNAEAANRRSL
jgi:hypothetical protein